MTDTKDKKSDYRKTFKQLNQNLTNFLSQLNISESETSTNQGFDANIYWENLLDVSKKIGFEANKITIMWINSPLPSNQDMIAVCGALEIACLALLNGYHSYPAQDGRLVKGSLKIAFQELLEECCNYSSVLLKTLGCKYTNSNHPLVPVCGLVMKHCEGVTLLPRDNRAACANKLKAEANVIKDALRELDEARTTDGFMDEFMDSEESWSDADKEIMGPLLGMIKTSGALVKKCMDAVRKQEPLSPTDTYESIVEKFSRISPFVDDLALTIYPPLNWEEAKQHAWNLKQVLEENLEYLSGILTDPDSVNWQQFISKAVTHNVAEIQRIFILHGLATLSLS